MGLVSSIHFQFDLCRLGLRRRIDRICAGWLAIFHGGPLCWPSWVVAAVPVLVDGLDISAIANGSIMTKPIPPGLDAAGVPAETIM